MGKDDYDGSETGAQIVSFLLQLTITLSLSRILNY